MVTGYTLENSVILNTRISTSSSIYLKNERQSHTIKLHDLRVHLCVNVISLQVHYIVSVH